jgi:hypothetical protein
VFVGNLAVALAAKQQAPKVGLGWFMGRRHRARPRLADLRGDRPRARAARPGGNGLHAAGVFDSYPWSHSLVMSFVWGGVLACIARGRTATQVSVLLVALVVSHWVLDFASHAPDMPLWPGPSPKFGLGLWYSIPATLIVEGVMWVVGSWIYLRAARRPMSATIAFWSLVLICTVMWAGGPWQPPPPSVQALGWFALIGWIILTWAAFADRQLSA